MSKAKLKRRGNPDQISIQDSVSAFYAELRDPAAADSRVSGELGDSVIDTCETIVHPDWESRTQKAVFDTSRTREELGWAPISDPELMVSKGIGGSLASWLAARE